MSRWVIPQATGASADAVRKSTKGNRASVQDEADQGDSAIDRIVKYVPAEIVSTYTLLFTGLVGLGAANAHPERVTAGLILVFFIATIAYVVRSTTGAIRWAHLGVSPIGFLAWAYPISSALLGDWFVPLIAFGAQALVILLSIFVVPRPQ